MNRKYNPKKIEKKWQDYWAEKKLFEVSNEEVNRENKMYILPQLPYPSGAGLHVGHAEVYTACDVYARYNRMVGKKVLQVIGWDAFGLPAENYAIKTNIHPRISTNKAIDNFRNQIKSLGISLDWTREVGSHNPDYYHWTQWFFLLMYKNGLAYRKQQFVNWCEGCKTVLANEQVVDGKCERCGTVIEQREMYQWYLKITEYAERLIKDLDKVDWPTESIKRQRDWIGKSEGALIDFKIKDTDFKIKVFTTRPDTIFGATYLVLAPENKLIKKLKDKILNWPEVEKYQQQTKLKTELERQIEKEKTGVELKGIKVVNPVNNEELPIFIADYVLNTYGTGAIMSVPAHDERDYEFAKKFNLPIKTVVKPKEKTKNEELFTGVGENINSDFLNGLKTKEAKNKIISWLEEKQLGQKDIKYKLRDWSVSRQRFWGAPIPMIFSAKRRDKKYTYLFLHGWACDTEHAFWPWLKEKLETNGQTVIAPKLPNNRQPKSQEQLDYLLTNYPQIKKADNLVIVARSFGGIIAYRLLEKLTNKAAKVVLVDVFHKPEFVDQNRVELIDSDTYEFNWAKIKQNSDEFVIIADKNFRTIAKEQFNYLQKQLDARLILTKPNFWHFGAEQEQIIYDEAIVSGFLPVPEKDLPVLLPDDVDFKPTGESPLNYSQEFQKQAQKKYGEDWQYEPDTLDTFMCSSWYYYRYLDPHNDKEFASQQALKWMPVDFYLGGPEHVNGHLLYSRFFTKVLYDRGYVDFDEPFLKHRHQGLILGEDNRKMSKRWGNSINPTDVVNEYGADTCRMYEMFMGPLEDDKPWDTNGVKGIRRFLERVYNLHQEIDIKDDNIEDLNLILHQTIKGVTEDIENLKFNTAISKLMILINKVYKQKQLGLGQYKIFLKLLNPFAPHLAEELWFLAGEKESLNLSSWPKHNKDYLKIKKVLLVVQINGKVRSKLEIDSNLNQEQVREIVLKDEKVKQWLNNQEIKKFIYIPGKIVSIVV